MNVFNDHLPPAPPATDGSSNMSSPISTVNLPPVDFLSPRTYKAEHSPGSVKSFKRLTKQSPRTPTDNTKLHHRSNSLNQDRDILNPYTMVSPTSSSKHIPSSTILNIHNHPLAPTIPKPPMLLLPPPPAISPSPFSPSNSPITYLAQIYISPYHKYLQSLDTYIDRNIRRDMYSWDRKRYAGLRECLTEGLNRMAMWELVRPGVAAAGRESLVVGWMVRGVGRVRGERVLEGGGDGNDGGGGGLER
ncbi:hypothetical protein EX30DRAFT_373865 [Ascodesmis nigricans]|uniref:Uncharacterized protein n=1 Tax=Ascodesmis nigricans TaxID=341454 RepID=A0A4S2MN85_9PEZI|nr:hypothetical protein EX30DRAFT_373865 [Ascodesmis nigricans]